MQGPIRKGGDRALYRACLWRLRAARGPLGANPWPEDHVVDLVLRAAQNPTSTTEGAADLVQVITEFRDALVPYSAAAGLFSRAVNLSFGSAGVLSMPTITDLPLADFVREGAPMPVVMGLSSLASMVPYKFGTTVSMTNEMMRSSSAEIAMRAALLNNVGPSLDRRLFDANPGVPGLRPPGLLFGVPPLTAAGPPATTSPSEMMIEDLEALVEALAPYGGNGNIVFICSAKHSVRLVKSVVAEKGFPTLISSTVTDNLIAVAANALVVAMNTPSIDVSGETVFHEEDTTPLPIDGATPVRSAWQTDSVGLRFRLPVSWALLAPAVAWLTPAW
jgi:hypothetical protein